MDAVRIELDAAVAEPDDDRDALGVYQGVAAAVAVSAGYAVFMARHEPGLTRRQRGVGVAATAVIAIFGVAGAVAPRWFVRTVRQRLPAPVLPAAGLAALAGSAPDRSPLFFPAVLLTAVGGGTTSVRRSPLLGGAAGAGYVASVLVQRRAWRRWDRQLWWNVSMWPAFTVAAPIGALVGGAALSIRALERARDRDRELASTVGASAREALGRLATEAAAVASQMDGLLLRVAARHAADAELLAAVGATRDRIHHLTLAPVMVEAATGGRLDLARTIESVVATYRWAWPQLDLSLEIDVPAERAVDARSTTALVGVLKIALDNVQRGRPRSVAVRVCERGDAVALDVEDDGGTTQAPPPGEWGLGLTEGLQLCQALGGRLSLEPAAAGLALRAVVPLVPVAPAGLQGLGGAVGGRLDEAIRRCERIIRGSDLIGGVGCLMTADRTRAGLAASLAFAALAGLDELRADARSAVSLEATAELSAVGLLWPAGGRPASGWIGAGLFLAGLRHGARAAAVPTAAVTAALAVSAARVRRTVVPGRIGENLVFPLGCAAGGLAARVYRERLRRVEADAVQLRERGELIELLARGMWIYHGVIKPLRETSAWREGVMMSPDGQRLIHLSRQLLELVDNLKASMLVPEPLREFQEHLATRLAPTPVTVDGELPQPSQLRAEDKILERARESIARIALADLLAEKILDRYPPNLLGRWPLARLHLAVRPRSADTVEVSVRPIPPARRTTRSEHLDLVHVLAHLRGELRDGFGDGGFTFSMAASAVAGP
jgi:hypothetical protein